MNEAHVEYMTLTEYKRWVDAMVSRPESLEKARQHATGMTLARQYSAIGDRDE